jgi:hypothetical protein
MGQLALDLESDGPSNKSLRPCNDANHAISASTLLAGMPVHEYSSPSRVILWASPVDRLIVCAVNPSHSMTSIGNDPAHKPRRAEELFAVSAY